MTLLGAWNWHRIFRFDVWAVLFWVNVVVLVGIAVALSHSVYRRRPSAELDERPAPNEVAFLDDDQLEGPRLERVLGWSLVFISVFAVSMAAYWLRETTREKASVTYFDHNSINRGATLFSNDLMTATYDPAKSLRCADCHGVAGVGGSGANYVYKDPKTGKAYKVVWKAPALNTVLYRFSPQEVHDIITYGRPGSPMQAWGVAGGGPKNEQSINDLVSYIKSIQLPPGTQQDAADDLKHCDKPATALGQEACALDAARKQADTQLTNAQAALKSAKDQLAADQKSFTDQKCTTVLAQTEPSDAKVACRKLQDATQTYTDSSGTSVTGGDDQVAIDKAQASLDWATEWKARRANVTDGQLLFEISCARCHTKNWSIFDPTNADLKPEDLLGPPGGGGQLGFNLRDGNEQRRFPNTRSSSGAEQPYSGILSQIAFVINGADANKAYGVGGIGTAEGGGMPGQCNDALKTDPKILPLNHYGCMLTYASDSTNLAGTPNKGLVLTPDPNAPVDNIMIEQIVLYERCGLDLTDNKLTAPTTDYTQNCS